MTNFLQMHLQQQQQRNLVDHHDDSYYITGYNADANANNEEDSNNSNNGFIRDSFGLFIFLVALCIVFVIFFTVIVREYYWRKYGIEICFGGRFGRRGQDPRQRNSQYQTDRDMAEALQRQLNDETRELSKEIKRKERKLWYQSYLKPYTMIAKDEDFFFSNEVQEVQKKTLPNMDSTITDGDDDIDDDLESNINVDVDVIAAKSLRKRCETEDTSSEEMYGSEGFTSALSSNENSKNDEDDQAAAAPTSTDTDIAFCIPCKTNDECNSLDEENEETEYDQRHTPIHLCLRLPGRHGQRSVDATCAICLGEYTPDDKVSWSDLECQHAFHNECILPWLTKGKKRCPICRHWFVPGTKIDDQKAALQEASSRAMSEVEETEEQPINDVDIETPTMVVSEQQQQAEPDLADQQV